MINISDFLVQSDIGIGLPVASFDFKKIMELSEKDFSDFYFRLMEGYKKDGWWQSEQSTPKCVECRMAIASPKELRRYKGLSMHPECFRRYYSREDCNEGIESRYFKRVADLR